jgi:hypothetical protein
MHAAKKYHSVCRLLVAAGVVPSSPIFVTLMKEAPDGGEAFSLMLWPPFTQTATRFSS